MSGRKKAKLSTDSDIAIVYETLRDPDYANLPEVVMREVLSYLNPRELRRASSVCKRWYHLSRDTYFWKHIDTKDLNIQHHEILKFVEGLPPYVSQLRIYLAGVSPFGVSLLDIAEILTERCPVLLGLYFECCSLNGSSFQSYRKYMGDNAWTYSRTIFYRSLRGHHSVGLRLPRYLSVLSFQRTTFVDQESLSLLTDGYFPNIEVLDFTTSYMEFGLRKSLFSLFYSLKGLYIPQGKLSRSNIKELCKVTERLKVLCLPQSFKGRWLQLLNGHIYNLVELKLRGVELTNEDVAFVDYDTFPNLRTAYFDASGAAEEIVKKFFEFCRFLESLYVNHKLSRSQVILRCYKLKHQEIIFTEENALNAPE